jgi:hypothetical protein
MVGYVRRLTTWGEALTGPFVTATVGPVDGGSRLVVAVGV